ncbi:hypothetical protein, partial [Salmonella enterica]|uniref:hypothetical protein n=1 Tax=Salmonella enterica TaxID=28901 RepID=UPI0031355265
PAATVWFVMPNRLAVKSLLLSNPRRCCLDGLIRALSGRDCLVRHAQPAGGQISVAIKSPSLLPGRIDP